ncbi:MAG: ATP synthase F1 subunit delta [Candidatus Omnitrophica bacterium]|nr:ATP synthase F1 subunit delta [Candidatus Omnitrophota bacterium]
MRDRTLVTRYAQAYVTFALPKIGLPQIVEDMKSLRGVLREHPEFQHFLETPEVPQPDKARVIDHVMSEGFHLETREFLKYLISKKRINRIVDITDYIRVVYSHGEVVDAVLRTTFPVELDIVEAIKNKLAARLGKKINLYLELKPELLGGIQIVIGNKIMDGSIRHKLEELRKQLLKVQVVR